MGVRICILRDPASVREGPDSILSTVAGFEVVDDDAISIAAVRKTCARRPDVVIIETKRPSPSGPDIVRAIAQQCPTTNVLFVCQEDDPEMAIQTLAAGAAGYVLEDIAPENLVRAVYHVAEGRSMINPVLARRVLKRLAGLNGESGHLESLRSKLSGRELEVLLAVARGMSDREIARSLYLSKNTVKSHLKAIYRKLHLRNRAHAAALAISSGLAQFY